jgi:hypothetical protein
MYITKIGPGFVNYKKDALDSQPQVIKSTNSLPMVGGSLRVLRLLPPLKLVAMILTADRNLFTESTCDPSITEYFQARWWCRPGMFLEQKSIKGLSNGIDKKMIIFNNIFNLHNYVSRRA